MKYDNDEDRIKAKKEQCNKYANGNKWKCDVCNCEVNLGNKRTHLKSYKHFINSTGNDFKAELKNQWRCLICNVTIYTRNKSNHLKTKKHQRECPTCPNSEDEE
jgi:hypothetical protein